ncbi:hypothetical protein [Sphingobacterium suaedae]|uniref:Lipid A biosynthesis acyltransferase n=1 Tax=Sphingobacterium suaedae TaxID=1686402 RepID=A0ABW5KL75_9SPHI
MYQSETNNWSYALFSANLYQYMPNLRWDSHERIYNKWLRWHDGREASRRKIFLDHTFSKLSSESGIYILYHLGSHLTAPIALAEQGLKFDIILDRHVYIKSESLFLEMREHLNSAGEYYTFYFSDEPGLLLRCRKSFAEGRSILIFADGASGTSSTLKDRRVGIKFFQNILHVKSGIAVMSFLFDVPLHLILPKISDISILTVNQRIVKKKNEKRDDYVKRSLESVYSVLEERLTLEPWLWECWSYLHLNGMLYLDEVPVDKKINESLIILPLKGKYYMFDRRYFIAQYLNLKISK